MKLLLKLLAAVLPVAALVAGWIITGDWLRGRRFPYPETAFQGVVALTGFFLTLSIILFIQSWQTKRNDYR